jgi:hypothetical protein
MKRFAAINQVLKVIARVVLTNDELMRMLRFASDNNTLAKRQEFFALVSSSTEQQQQAGTSPTNLPTPSNPSDAPKTTTPALKKQPQNKKKQRKK